MGEAIGTILPMAVSVALSPVPIIAVVLMLGTRRGPAFLLGWLAGLLVVGTSSCWYPVAPVQMTTASRPLGSLS